LALVESNVMENDLFAEAEAPEGSDENPKLAKSRLFYFDDQNERVQAARSLLKSCEHLSELVPRLISEFESVKRWRISEGLQALIEQGLPTGLVDESLRALIRDPDVNIRVTAAYCLGTLRGQVEQSAQIFSKLLKHRWPEVRHAAAESLEEIGGPPKLLIPALIRALTSTQPFDKNDRDEEEADYFVRIHSAAALKRFGDEAEEALLAVLNKKHIFDRRWVIYALGEVGSSSRVVATLMACLKDSAVRVQDVTVDALVTISKSAMPELIEALRNSDQSVQFLLLRVFRKCNSADRAVPAVLQLLENGNEKLRQECIKTLEVISSRFSIPNLLNRSQRDELNGFTIRLFRQPEANPALDENPLSLEDERILKWFGEIKLQKYLGWLQLFWCIGKFDHVALMGLGKAMGTRDLETALKKQERLNPRFKKLALAIKENTIRLHCIPALETLFNVSPFQPDAWSKDEQMADFRTQKKLGTNPFWTPRGRKAWEYVDRFLTIRELLPPISFETE
jgi:HEAT repeat protein